jgi:acyl-CoA synthetase (AMP-forming)/AMP-acid ligase II
MSRMTRLARNKNLTVASLLDELLPLRGNRVVSYHEGLTALDGSVQNTQLFADLHREIDAMSRFLVEEAGLNARDRVAIFKTNDPYCFRWFMAVIRAGGIAVPLNPLLSPPEVHSIVTHCTVRILITDRAHHEKVLQSGLTLPVPVRIQSDNTPPIDDTFLRISRIHLNRPACAPAAIRPEDTVAIFHTSGTSGTPRGAMLSSRALLGGSATAAMIAPFIRKRDLALFTLPWAHIMAVSAALYGLIAGIPALFLERFDTERALGSIERYRVTSFIGVPAMFIKLLNAAPDPQRLASIRMWISASDHLPESYRRGLLKYGALYRLFGHRIAPPLFINIYGMVELGGSAMIGINLPFLPGSGEYCFAVPPFAIRIVDENDTAVRNGLSGECQVRGPGITTGYWENPDATRTLLTEDGWLRTGDLAVRNRLGLIRLMGRTKDVIKCGGYSVFASETEEILSSHPAVARATVIGVPHPLKGEAPLGVVELIENDASTEEELLDWCRAKLAPYKAPRRICIGSEGILPQGVTEKVLKRELRDRYKTFFQDDEAIQ